MLYNISYEIAGVILTTVVGVHFFREERLRNVQNALFGVFIIFILMACLLDVAGAITISYPHAVPLYVNWVVNQLFYFCQITLPVLLYLFVLNLTQLMTPRHKKNYPLVFGALRFGIINMVGQSLNRPFLLLCLRFILSSRRIIMAIICGLIPIFLSDSSSPVQIPERFAERSALHRSFVYGV
jgi:hypothetical protein